MTTTTDLLNSTGISLTDKLADAYEKDIQRAQEIIDAAERLPATCELGDEETLEKLANYVRQARAHDQLLEVKRKDEKEPIDRAGREVQAFFTPWQIKLNAAKTKAEGVINTHNRARETFERNRREEQAKAAAAEAQERADLAAQQQLDGRTGMAEANLETALDRERDAARLTQQAQGSAADLVRTTTAGGTVSSRATWEFEITDASALRATLGKLGEFFTKPEIEKAVRGYLGHCKRAEMTPELPGVRFYEDRKAIIR
jgi:hypothetical protein